MKGLFVGDLHASINNLEDTGNLFELIYQTLLADQNIELVCFLGDIFHTHAIVRQEVAFFVRNQFFNLMVRFAERGRRIRFAAIAGNHDYSTPSAAVPSNALRLVLSDQFQLELIDQDPHIIGPYLLCPFMGDNEKFVEKANLSPESRILICHQTFDGSKYENNHTAPNGVDQNRINKEVIISGHIHTRQTLAGPKNTVYYPGTPRAITAGEVNQDKGLMIYDPSTGSMEFVHTGHLVKQYIGFYLYQGDEEICISSPNEPIPWKFRDDVRIHVEGNEEFYEKVLKANVHLEGRVRFIPNIKKQLDGAISIESEGSSIESALHTYVYEICDLKQDLRDSVWQKFQTWMPKLGAKI